MKILIINNSDINGGAARATYRLHRALLDKSIKSNMLVQIKSSRDNSVFVANKAGKKPLGELRRKLDSLLIRFYPNRSRTIFSSAYLPCSSVIKQIEQIDPDIVHLNWICDGMLRIEDLVRIRKPVVWSLTDMWAFTGGCHYDEECGAFRVKCGTCKVLASNKKNDLSRLIFNRKKRIYPRLKNLTIIGKSRWIQNCAEESALLKNKRILNLPNPINTEEFKPENKKKAREILGLPPEKKLILFGAMRSTSDPRKGYRELGKALEKINEPDVEYVVFGNNEKTEDFSSAGNIHYLGNIKNDNELSYIYNACDITVVPSQQENLSNIILESLSCGTPVAAFDIGGNSDLIDHRHNGYLAEPRNTDDLAYGINWVIRNTDYNSLADNSRNKVLNDFDSKFVSGKYIELYKEILEDDS